MKNAHRTLAIAAAIDLVSATLFVAEVAALGYIIHLIIH